MELVFECGLAVALVVRLFGRCRQAFYQSKADIEKEVEHERKVIDAVREIRSEDPGIGGYKLWLMLIAMFGRDFVPGRDRFFVLLRRKGLMLPKPKPRHTTNSNHRYHKYKNLIKDFVPVAANQLWAADITYIALAGGDVCYLHLITDAYSHKIVGWALARTLKAAITMEALRMAINQAVAMSGSEILKGLIHHSDRGVQYCCDAYVAMLKAHEITISMCEDYNPTDNAVAESVNGKIKVESVYRQKCFNSFEHAYNVIARYIHFYNYRHLCQAEQTVWATAYASAPDKKLNAPSKGIRFCRTNQPGLCVSSMAEVSTKTAQLFRLCLPIQYDYKTTVYCFS